MKDKISVSIGTDHSYDCKADVIGRAGEGNVTQMELKIPSKLCSCSLYLDFEKPNGETYRTPKLPIKEGVATYNVQPFVLTDSGEIKVQAVFEKASGEIWKSEIKMYANHKSINVTEDIDGYIVPSGTLYIRENGTWDCSSYATVEVTVLSYSVKGIVELDPIALRRSSDNIEQSIDFQLYEEDMDGDPYSKIRFSDGNLTYIKSDGTEHTVFKYSNGTTWISGNYSGDPSKLNFGDYATVVSAEFYLWLKSVEKQQGGGESTATLIEKTFTANDTYNASDYGADGFSSVTVNVESGGEEANLGGITVTPTEDTQNILATDKGLDGFDEVIVEPIPDEYVKPSGTLTITENGLRTLQKDDGGYYDSVNVNVPSVEPTLKTLTITKNGTYIANDYNADGFSSVTVNANVKQNYCLVRFYNDDRTTLLYEIVVPYGSSAVYAGNTPVSSLGTDYIFTGFEPSTANVTADIDCYAVYDEPVVPDGPEITTLEAASWADISAVSAAGTAANYFAVGDTKAVTLNGKVGAGLTLNNATYYVYIIGFNHNSEIEGNGITFGTFKTADGKDIALCDSNYMAQTTNGTKTFTMNHWEKNARGGWAGCDLRYDVLGSTDVAPSGYGSSAGSSREGYNATETCATNPVADTLMAALPADLRAVMKPMTIYTNNKGTNNEETSVTATVDYLPLLAAYEVLGENNSNRNTANEYEKNKQKQYAYYAAGNSRYKYKHSIMSELCYWWWRSPSASTSTCYGQGSDADNAACYGAANHSVCLAPIFKV